MKAPTLLIIAALTTFACSASVRRAGSYGGLGLPDTDQATVFVYRDSSFAGAANNYDIVIDDQLVGSLPNGSFFSVPAKPGVREISADTGMGEGSRVTLAAGEIYCMKLGLNFNVLMKSADIDPVPLEQCDREMKTLDRVELD